MNQKQRIIRGSILLSLGIVLAGLGIYFNYYKKSASNNLVDEEKILDYLGINKDDNLGIDIFLDDFETVIDPKETLKSVDNNKKILFAINNLEASNNELTKDNIDKVIKKYFYTENLILEDIICSCEEKLYIYNKETNKYEENNNHVDHEKNNIIKLIDKKYTFSSKNNNYVLEVKKLYAKDENNCLKNDVENCEMKYFNDYLDAYNSVNELFRTNSMSSAQNKFKEIVLEPNYKTYVYTFSYENETINIEKYEKNNL